VKILFGQLNKSKWTSTDTQIWYIELNVIVSRCFGAVFT